MNAILPILWIATTAPPGADASPPPAPIVAAPTPMQPRGALARPIEIVLVGAESDRRDMEAALQALVGPDAAVSWSARDALPGVQALAERGPDAVNQIWIDVTDSSRVRVVLPAAAPATSPIVRIVDSPASDGDLHQPVMRETVAQIVSGAVHALHAETSGPPRAVVLVTPPPTVPGPVEQSISQPASRASALEHPVPRAYSLAMVAGVHTSPFLLAEPHDQLNWLGLTLALSLRRETPTLLLELRAVAERSERSIDAIDLHSQFYSAILGASRRMTSGPFTFGLGLEVGALLLRQQSEIVYNADSGSGAGFALPGVLGASSSAGFLVGLLGEASVAVTRRWYLHLVASLPRATMKVDDVNDGATAHWQSDWYAQVLGGVGAYF